LRLTENPPFLGVTSWALAILTRLAIADFKGNKNKFYLILWVLARFRCQLAGC